MISLETFSTILWVEPLEVLDLNRVNLGLGNLQKSDSMLDSILKRGKETKDEGENSF